MDKGEGQKQQSIGETIDSYLRRAFWLAVGGLALVGGVVWAAQMHENKVNHDEMVKKKQLLSEYNGRSFMVTGPDTVSEVVINKDNYKFEKVVSYDFAHGLAIYGKDSPAPGVVLGLTQLPPVIVDQIKQSACDVARKSVLDGTEVEQDVGVFFGRHCLPG